MTTTRRFEVQNHDGQTIAEGVLFRDGTTVMQTPDLAAVTHMFKTFEDFTASTIGAVHWIGEDDLSAGDDLASRLRLAHEARKEAEQRAERLEKSAGVVEQMRKQLGRAVVAFHGGDGMTWNELIEYTVSVRVQDRKFRRDLIKALDMREDDAADSAIVLAEVRELKARVTDDLK